MTPSRFSRLKKACVPLHLHTHYNQRHGQHDVPQSRGSRRGYIDTCLAPYASGTSMPAIDPSWRRSRGHRGCGHRPPKTAGLSEHLEKIAPKYIHLLADHGFSIIDNGVLAHQFRRLISNLASSLRR
jgi:pyruvate/oxaloacetate carboxyltransferase